MQKDELIQLHMFLLQIKSYFEKHWNYQNTVDFFSRYNQLEVQPQQVFKSKKDHRYAVLELCKGLNHIMETMEGKYQQKQRENGIL